MKFYLATTSGYSVIVSAPDLPTARLLCTAHPYFDRQEAAIWQNDQFSSLEEIGSCNPAVSKVWSINRA